MSRIPPWAARRLVEAAIAVLLAAAILLPWHHQQQQTGTYQRRYLTALCEAAADFNVAKIAFLRAPHPAASPAAPAIDVQEFTAGMGEIRDDYIRQYNTAAQRIGHAQLAKLGLPNRIDPDHLDRCLQ